MSVARVWHTHTEAYRKLFYKSTVNRIIPHMMVGALLI